MLVQVTPHTPPVVSPEELVDVTRTLRYAYEPDDDEAVEHAAALTSWLKEPHSRDALALLGNNPAYFPRAGPILWPLQECYAHPPYTSELVHALGVAVTPLVLQQILAGASVACSTSGGKDGTAAALAFNELLDWLGHKGERVVIFSDVGRLDWPDSGESAQRLADLLHQRLVTVRMADGMIGEWRKRWRNNRTRYANLKCVKMIMPWSAPGRLRFCTSSKFFPLTQELTRLFAGTTILSATGVRRQESSDRLNAEVCSPQPDLRRVKLATSGFDVNPVTHWREEHVYAYLAARGFRLPDSYRLFHSDRHSCRLCVMQSAQAVLRAAANPLNHPVLLELVAFEVETTYSFRQGHWLADTAYLLGLLDAREWQAVKEAKERAAERERLEETIPEDLLYCEGWPRRVPTPPEARLYAAVRRGVGRLVNLEVKYTDEESVTDRFAELLAEKEARLARRGPLPDAPKKSRRRKKRRHTPFGAPPPQLTTQGQQLSLI
jgi:3'-phosphoadenosine 5'-phosphosulfate sulfotransferase (PAPS reductase)/FAD synthetase